MEFEFDVTKDHPDDCCAIDDEGASCPEPAAYWPVKVIGLCESHAIDWMRENLKIRGIVDDG
jgi:hypothetical protein